MELDRLRGQEERRTHFAIRLSFGDLKRDLQLARRELLGRGRLAALQSLAARPQLGAGPFRPRCGTEPVEGLERGSKLLTDPRSLIAELDRVRALGLAVNNEELAYGLRSMAVPVWGKTRSVVAAINLAAHRSAASIEQLVERLGPTLRRRAAEISAHIGY